MIKKLKILFNFLIVFLNYFTISLASNGDRTNFFIECRLRCNRNYCTEDGSKMLPHAIYYFNQTVFDKLLFWSCFDECQYLCMWNTVDAFMERNLGVPQFYGKWPFRKFLGLQEPASVLFSLLNCVAHLTMLKKFRDNVPNDSPCYKLWHIFSLVNINGWIWSIVFHSRDFEITEFLDYIFAFSIILVALYCMIIRILHNHSLLIKGALTAAFISLYFNYVLYLSDKFDYSFNMKVNIFTAILSAFGWISWSVIVRKRRPYYWKIILFYILIGISSCLEVMDFPPFLWIFDAHSLWHLSSFPITLIFYSFIIEDCKALRKEKLLIGEIDKKFT